MTSKREHFNLVFVTTHPLSLVVFLAAHLKTLYPHFDLEVFANTKDPQLLQDVGLDLPINFIPLKRTIDIWLDFKVLWLLFKSFREGMPDAVHTITPKAGLLGMLAAWLARVPIRVHTFTGQVWVTRNGFMRILLKVLDWMIASLATDVLVDSQSQKVFLIEQGVLSKGQGKVLGAGSICGVDTKRFSPNPETRKAIRLQLGSSDDALVCLFLGRLNQDKGVTDLAIAFSKIASIFPHAELWVVGPEEQNIFDQILILLSDFRNRVKRVDYTRTPEKYMQAADLFCLPSYREGFGSSVIEAAACGIPALTSRIYGLTDAVVEGETGWMHVAADVDDISLKLEQILSNSNEIIKRGSAAQKYAKRFFDEGIITKAMLDFYKNRLESSKTH
jgi:glycosyltransferase involved in cell wall biosynthesis